MLLGVFGEHKPGFSSVWDGYEKSRDLLVDNAGRGDMGTPARVYEHTKGYADIGVDQVIYIQQSGRNKHDHICESLSDPGRARPSALREFSKAL